MIKGSSNNDTSMILGRDFLKRFKSTTFDWQRGMVQIDEEWLTPKIWVYGGALADRIAVAGMEENHSAV